MNLFDGDYAAAHPEEFVQTLENILQFCGMRAAYQTTPHPPKTPHEHVVRIARQYREPNSATAKLGNFFFSTGKTSNDSTMAAFRQDRLNKFGVFGSSVFDTILGSRAQIFCGQEKSRPLWGSTARTISASQDLALSFFFCLEYT